MNLSELSERLGRAEDVLRVETLDAYSSASDADMLERYVRGEPKPDLEEKRPWLDRLAAAAQHGRPWKRLRVVTRPVPQYVRYACEFGYVDNVAAGEDVRVLDEREHAGRVDELRDLGDLVVIDHHSIIFMHYDERGRFVEGHDDDSDVTWSTLEHLIRPAWGEAVPFTAWWDTNPDLHRTLVDSH